MITALERFELEEAENFVEGIEEYGEGKAEEERFKIRDLGGANWALRKIAAYKKKKAEIADLAEEEKFRVECWEQNENEQIERGIAYFESLLGQYLTEQRKEDPKFKISTPYGKVSTRKQQPKWEYIDDAVLEYLKSVDAKDLIRIKEELNKAELKKAVTVENGKAIYEGVKLPGITILEQPEKIVVNVEV